jgi:protein-tyrosine phosphatase
MISRLRTIRHNARLARERWLHSLRRSAAKKRLAAYEGTFILVVCQGNICRSPFAEAVLQVSLPAGMEIRSAGLVAPGRCAPPDAISAARRFGFDLSKHTSRLVNSGLVRAAGLILVMDPEQGRELVDRFGADRNRIMILGDLDSLPIDARTIPDPVHQSRDFFIECYERIDRCARELGRTLHRAARARAPLYGEVLREFPSVSAT